MEYLKKFEQHSEYEAYISGSGVVLPNVSICDDEPTHVHYNPSQAGPVNYVYMTKGYSFDEDNDGTRLEYHDEYEFNEKMYSRFHYSYIDEESGERVISPFDDWGFVLFENRNFTKLTFPYSMEVLQGYIYEEGETDIYPFLQECSNRDLYGFTEAQTNMVIMQRRSDIGTDANGKEYVDLGLTSGTLWAKCNVGTDTETEYGGYYQWGGTENMSSSDCTWDTCPYSNDDGSVFTKYNTSTECGTVDNKIVLDLEDDAVRANMGGDWKMPSVALMIELYMETNHEWVEDYNGSGKNGRLFTSKKNGNTMFFPAAGSRVGSSFYYQGDGGNVWSSLLLTDYPGNAWKLDFDSDNCYMYYRNRCFGFSVRGIL